VTAAVFADDCEVVLAARVSVVLVVDASAGFLDLRPDGLASVVFASSFVDDVGEDSVLAAPGFGFSASLSSSPFEATVVDADDAVFESDVFESDDFDSAEEAFEESD
jgi:hypothetical protein